MKSHDSTSGNGPTPGEMLGWIELACWTTVALAPFLYWVNGPAVSTDQFVVRTTLVTIALLGGLTLRITKLMRRRTEKSKQEYLNETE